MFEHVQASRKSLLNLVLTSVCTCILRIDPSVMFYDNNLMRCMCIPCKVCLYLVIYVCVCLMRCVYAL